MMRALGAILARVTRFPSKRPRAPMRWRHVWSHWEPPPNTRRRSTPLCVFCGMERTTANGDEACPVVQQYESDESGPHTLRPHTE